MDYRVDWMDDNRDLHTYQHATENEAVAFATGIAIARHYEEMTPYCEAYIPSQQVAKNCKN